MSHIPGGRPMTPRKWTPRNPRWTGEQHLIDAPSPTSQAQGSAESWLEMVPAQKRMGGPTIPGAFFLSCQHNDLQTSNKKSPQHRWPFGKIDGPGKWNKPHLNQGPLCLLQTNQKGHLCSSGTSTHGRARHARARSLRGPEPLPSISGSL